MLRPVRARPRLLPGGITSGLAPSKHDRVIVFPSWSRATGQADQPTPCMSCLQKQRFFLWRGIAVARASELMVKENMNGPMGMTGYLAMAGPDRGGKIVPPKVS